MSRVLPPGYGDVSVELKHALLTRPAYITYGVRLELAATDAQVIVKTIADTHSVPGGFLSLLDNQVTIQSVTVRIGTDGGEPVVAVDATTRQGSTAVTGPPPNCALLVHKLTNRGGRRGRGRLFIPWTLSNESVNEAGIIDGAAVNQRQTWLMAWHAALDAASVPMCILHNTGSTTPGNPDLVTGLKPQTLIATQRRRLGR